MVFVCFLWICLGGGGSFRGKFWFLVVVIMLIVLEKIWRGGNRFFWLLVLEFWVLFFVFGEILVEIFLNFELFLEDDLFLVFILKIKYFWFELNFVYLFWIVKCWYVFVIFFEVSEVCFVRLVFVVFFLGWDVIMFCWWGFLLGVIKVFL